MITDSLATKPAIPKPVEIAQAEGSMVPITPSNMWNSPGVANAYARFAENSWYQDVQSALIERIATIRAHSLTFGFDVGSGTGSGTLQLARALGGQATIVGIDSSEQMIHFAQTKVMGNSAISFKVGDAVDFFSHQSGTIDLVTAFNSIHLFPNPAEFIGSAATRLSASGVLGFCTGFCADAIDRNMVRPYVTLARKAREIGTARFPDHFSGEERAHTKVLSSEEYRRVVTSFGLAIEHCEMREVAIDSRSIAEFFEVPGSGSDILPHTLTAEQRGDILRQALDTTGIKDLRRRWLLLVASKAEIN